MAIAGIDEARLQRAFLEEAEDLSQKLGNSLLALETDRGNPQLINEVFRLTHSLKSESALMGYATLSKLAHRMEDVLGFARDGTLPLEKPVMERIFVGSDLIAEMMAAIGKGGSDANFDIAAVIRDLSSAAGMSVTPSTPPPLPGAEGTEEAKGETAAQNPPGTAAREGPTTPLMELGEFERRQLAEARDRGETLFRLSVDIDEAESMKFPRAYLVFSNLELMANVVKANPSMEGEPADDARYATTTVLLTTAGEEESMRVAASVDQIAAVRIERCDYDAFLAPDREGTGRAAPAEVAAGMPPPPPGAVVEMPQSLPAATSAPSAPGGIGGGGGAIGMEQNGAAIAERTSIRVDTRKLDDLWSLIAELVLHKSHISRLSEDLGRGVDVLTVRDELAESFDSLDKISGGMQQAMMDTRMIPISIIFGKLPRLVRDLSRKLGKPVDLVLSGEDTEIDRSVVEALSDPLTHIIRNSLDHGIESPEERVRQGKNAKGRVSISARRQGGNIVIELVDDGRGMDIELIRRKATAMGIAGAGSFNESQLMDLVFLPGFSTKDAVTDLSGRGVGMDVVATRVRSGLKGDVMLRTETGRGTHVTLVLPLTLTIVNALLVRGDSQLYAIPLTDVDSTAKLLASEIDGEEGRQTSAWMGEKIPVHSLGALLGNGRRGAEEYFAVVLRHGDRRAFLAVDELIEEREVVIKPVDDLLNAQRLFSGVSVLEDGRLVFILDTSFIRRENF